MLKPYGWRRGLWLRVSDAMNQLSQLVLVFDSLSFVLPLGVMLFSYMYFEFCLPMAEETDLNFLMLWTMTLDLHCYSLKSFLMFGLR